MVLWPHEIITVGFVVPNIFFFPLNTISNVSIQIQNPHFIWWCWLLFFFCRSLLNGIDQHRKFANIGHLFHWNRWKTIWIRLSMHKWPFECQISNIERESTNRVEEWGGEKQEKCGQQQWLKIIFCTSHTNYAWSHRRRKFLCEHRLLSAFQTCACENYITIGW